MAMSSVRPFLESSCNLISSLSLSESLHSYLRDRLYQVCEALQNLTKPAKLKSGKQKTNHPALDIFLPPLPRRDEDDRHFVLCDYQLAGDLEVTRVNPLARQVGQLPYLEGISQ